MVGVIDLNCLGCGGEKLKIKYWPELSKKFYFCYECGYQWHEQIGFWERVADKILKWVGVI